MKRKPDFPTASIAGRAFGKKLDFNKVRAFSIEGKVPDGELEIEAEDADYVAQALDMLPPAPLTDESWSQWTGALKETTGRKGRALFMPLRLALTGQAHGPEMQHLLPLIGYDKVQARLQGQDEG